MDSAHSLEIEVMELRIPSLSDFSKVKCILTANHYTQSLTYPFKTMAIPRVDDFSILEISITHANQIIAGVDVPLTLFKNRRYHTFKLTDPNSSPEKKKSSFVKPKFDSAEITIGIKYILNDPTIEGFKSQIKDLEKKIRNSVDLVDEGFKSRRDLQSNFEDATKTLSKMIQSQDDTIKNLLNEREKINDYLKTVENDLKIEKNKYLEAISQVEELENSFGVCKTDDTNKPNISMNKINKMQAKSSEGGPRRKKSENSPLQIKKNPSKDLSQKKIEILERENKELILENNKLANMLDEYKERAIELERKIEEINKFNYPESYTTEKQQSSESIVLNLRAEMAKTSVKYKSRITKLSESRNNLIQDKKELLEKNHELEEKLREKEEELQNYRRGRNEVKENINYTDQPLTARQNSHKLLGKYASNVMKIEKSLSKSPKISHENLDPFAVNKKSQELERQLKTVGNAILDKSPQSADHNRKSVSLHKPEIFDTLNMALDEFISANESNLEINFIQEKEGVYMFGSKRVFLKLEHGKIYVRIGAGFMSIEEFVRIYTPLEQDKTERKRARENQVSQGPFKKITINQPDTGKFSKCFGIQRRSASVSKLAPNKKY